MREIEERFRALTAEHGELEDIVLDLDQRLAQAYTDRRGLQLRVDFLERRVEQLMRSREQSVVAGAPSPRVVVGVPAYTPPAPCRARSGDALTGRQLRDALRRARDDGVVPADWRALVATCELAPAEVARYLNLGGLKVHRQGRYWASLQLWKMAVNVDPSKLSSRFNLACSYARMGRLGRAMDELRQIRRAGREGKRWLRKARFDIDLSPLRGDPEFLAVTATD